MSSQFDEPSLRIDFQQHVQKQDALTTGRLDARTNDAPQCHNDVIREAAKPFLLPHNMRDTMPSTDDFRFNAHHFLLDMDAATNHLMMLVVSHEVTGSRWDEAVSRHKQAYAAWASILTGIQTDPMPALDGRPVEGNSSTAK